MSTQMPSNEYNYDHFHGEMLAKDMKLSRDPEGPRAGERAPSFELDDVDGRTWRLDDLRGRPVVLVLGSGTCPLTAGSLPGLQKLHDERVADAQWLFVYVREAHPGEEMPAHYSLEQKHEQARRFRSDTGLSWPVLIDSLDGRVHRQYGLQPNGIYLLDERGAVLFRGDIAHAPTLRDALQMLGGEREPFEDHHMHMLGATAHGLDAIERGGDVSWNDVKHGAPPLAANLRAGHGMESALGPIADRSEHIPVWRFAAAAGAVVLLLVAFGAFSSRGNGQGS